MTEITEESHQLAARRFKQLYSLYQQNRDLISVGAYTQGSDQRVDEAIAMNPALMAFLQQNMDQAVSFQDSLATLQAFAAAQAQMSGGNGQ